MVLVDAVTRSRSICGVYVFVGLGVGVGLVVCVGWVCLCVFVSEECLWVLNGVLRIKKSQPATFQHK